LPQLLEISFFWHAGEYVPRLVSPKHKKPLLRCNEESRRLDVTRSYQSDNK